MIISALVAVAGVFAITLIVGLVTLVLAEAPLVAVARSAARDVSRSFWIGALGQLLAVPLLAAGSLLLALTVIGVFLIPFFALAWVLAYAGALTLGFLSGAYLVGRAFAGGSRQGNARRGEVRALSVGILLLSVPWFIAALLVEIPFVGVFARLAALALLWAMTTVGFGAVIRSRGGRKVQEFERTFESVAPLWATPTPVGGVVAARVPAPVPHAAASESSEQS